MDWNLEQFQTSFEKLSKLPRPYRIAIFPLLVAVVVGLYGYLFYAPTHKAIEAARSKRLEMQRKLNEVRTVATNLDAFEAEIADLERQLKHALRQLPDSKELPVLLTDITSLGKNSGLEVKAFRPQAEVRRDFYAEVPIEIEFSGLYHDIASFFDRVAKLPRIVNVAQLEVKISDETTTDTYLTVKGKATTFRFVEAPPEETEKAGKQKRGKRHKRRGRGKAQKEGAA